MTALLETEITKLTSAQKLELIDRLWADLEASGLPPGILCEGDPDLEAKLELRLREAKEDPGQCLTLEQFKASFGDK